MSNTVGIAKRPAGARSIVRPSGTVLRSPWAVAALVFLIYGVWLGVIFHSGYDARESIVLGKNFVLRSHASSVIKYDPHFHYSAGGSGYDGQFFYYIAVDPLNARYYMDNAAYRYSKILYPATARLLALGQANLIPYTLILVNWLAVAGGTLAIAAWLRRKALSPWFAVVYGFSPGVFVGFQRDLTEPLSYALVALAIYLYEFGGRYRLGWSALAFALAVLTRDKTGIFAGLYGAALLFRSWDWRWHPDLPRLAVRNVLQACVFVGAAAAPLVMWKLVLRHWLHAVIGVQQGNQAAPFSGALSGSTNRSTEVLYVIVVFIPAAICAAMALWAVVRRLWKVQVATLLVLIEVSVITLNPGFFADVFGVLRVSIGVILAAIYCIPVFDRLTNGNRLWFFGASSCWLSLMLAYLLLAPIWMLSGRM